MPWFWGLREGKEAMAGQKPTIWQVQLQPRRGTWVPSPAGGWGGGRRRAGIGMLLPLSPLGAGAHPGIPTMTPHMGAAARPVRPSAALAPSQPSDVSPPALPLLATSPRTSPRQPSRRLPASPLTSPGQASVAAPPALPLLPTSPVTSSCQPSHFSSPAISCLPTSLLTSPNQPSHFSPPALRRLPARPATLLQALSARPAQRGRGAHVPCAPPPRALLPPPQAHNHVVAVQRIHDDFCVKVVSVDSLGAGIKRFGLLGECRAPAGLNPKHGLERLGAQGFCVWRGGPVDGRAEVLSSSHRSANP
jgi:hypothetical protein